MTSFTTERIKVNQLRVDERVQRDGLKETSVRAMVKDFNEGAMGIITVSRRPNDGDYIIDGWHRTETVRRRTDNEGDVLCHVYEGLSLAEEAILFLELNAKTAVTLMDKFKARLTAEDPTARAIDEMVRYYGWTVSPIPANGNVNAIGSLERIYTLSLKVEAEPNLVQFVFLVISRAWDIDRNGAAAVIMDAIARIAAEYTASLDVDRLIKTLGETKGGPQGLLTRARTMAHARGGKVSMAVAELVVEEYNKGLGSKNKLTSWRHRS